MEVYSCVVWECTVPYGLSLHKQVTDENRKYRDDLSVLIRDLRFWSPAVSQNHNHGLRVHRLVMTTFLRTFSHDGIFCPAAC